MDTLQRLRSEIDKIDLQILKDLKRRFLITKRVRQWKKKHRMPPYHKAREEQILRRLESYGRRMGLSSKMVKQVYEILFTESRGKI